MSIDYVNSQPLISCALLNPMFYINRDAEEGTGGKTFNALMNYDMMSNYESELFTCIDVSSNIYNTIYDDIYNTISMLPSIMFPETSTSPVNTNQESFKSLYEKGVLYEYIEQHALSLGISNKLTRQQVKAAVFQMIGLDGGSLKVLLGNLGEGIGNFIGGIGKGVFKQLQDLDAEKLKELGIGIGGIGLGIAAFSAAKIIGGVGAVVDGLSSFFGAESPIDTIVRLSKDKSIDPVHLAAIGEAIGPLGRGIAAFSGFEVNSGFFTGETDLEKFIVAISRIGDSDVNINTAKIKNLGEALEPLGNGMSGFANVDIAKIVDTSTFGKSTLEIFFLLLALQVIP